MTTAAKNSRVIFWLYVALWAIALAMLFTGCASRPVAAVRAGFTAVTQRGAAAVPASAETRTDRASLPLPAGTVVKVQASRPAVSDGVRSTPAATAANDVAGSWSVTLPSPSVLSVETVSERATAPQAFTPPPPPSPSDLAAGRAAWVFRIAIFAGIAAGLFGLIKGWDFVALGGGCVAAGGLLGLALDSVPFWLWAVLGAGVAIAGTGWAVWHFKVKPNQPANVVPFPAP